MAAAIGASLVAIAPSAAQDSKWVQSGQSVLIRPSAPTESVQQVAPRFDVRNSQSSASQSSTNQSWASQSSTSRTAPDAYHSTGLSQGTRANSRLRWRTSDRVAEQPFASPAPLVAKTTNTHPVMRVSYNQQADAFDPFSAPADPQNTPLEPQPSDVWDDPFNDKASSAKPSTPSQPGQLQMPGTSSPPQGFQFPTPPAGSDLPEVGGSDFNQAAPRQPSTLLEQGLPLDASDDSSKQPEPPTDNTPGEGFSPPSDSQRSNLNESKIEPLTNPFRNNGNDAAKSPSDSMPSFPGGESSGKKAADEAAQDDMSLDRFPPRRDDGLAPPKNKTEFSCSGKRKKVAEMTIDRISLDIAPAFRPDVMDNDKYLELRKKFETEQKIRDWRDIDGSLIGRGALTGMRYEDIVIRTPSGGEMRLPVSQLSEPDLAFLSSSWGLPKQCRIAQVAYQPRQWSPMTYHWKASNLCHNPLYFEEVQLERYGHTLGPIQQPVFSSAHFFINIAMLPYKMGIHSPNECQYALGYYRPGNCAPYLVPPVTLSLRGALSEAAVIAGGFWLIP